MTLEEILQAFVDALEDERDSIWRTGSVVSAARKISSAHGIRSGDKKSVRALLGQLAAAGKCTVACLNQRADVHEAFEPGLRDREHDWSWHRSVMHAAKRTGADVPLVLHVAQRNGYGTRELNKLGAKLKPEYPKCPTCGGPYRLEFEEPQAGGD